jgi:hypothetical protein
VFRRENDSEPAVVKRETKHKAQGKATHSGEDQIVGYRRSTKVQVGNTLIDNTIGDLFTRVT